MEGGRCFRLCFEFLVYLFYDVEKTKIDFDKEYFLKFILSSVIALQPGMDIGPSRSSRSKNNGDEHIVVLPLIQL